MSLESVFQRELKKELKERYPGCYIFKNDANQIQGIPDLTILYKDKWACLEVKRSKDEMRNGVRKNQRFRVNELNEMSYAAFIYPENKEEVLDELDRRFQIKR